MTRVKRSQLEDVAANTAESTNIKETLLNKINRFSTENGNNFDQLEAIENDGSDSTKNSFKKLLNSEQIRLQKLKSVTNPVLNTNIRATWNQKSISTDNVDDNGNDQVSNTIPVNVHIGQIQLATEQANKIKDWRMRFYKVYRNAKKRVRSRKEGSEASWGQNKSYKEKAVLNNKKKIIIFEKPRDGETVNNDWTNFLSFRSAQVRPAQEEESQTSVGASPFELERSGYQYNVSLTSPFQPYLETTIPEPSPTTYYYRSYQEPSTILPPNFGRKNEIYQYENEVYSPAENLFRALPIPNQKSTEASIHTVQISAPPLPPTHYTDATDNEASIDPESYKFRQKQPQMQLLSEYEESILTTQTPFRQQNFVSTLDNSPKTTDATEHDEFETFDNDNYLEPQVNGPSLATDLNQLYSIDQRCNSPNLRAIMTTAIVENDSESSKHAIREAAEKALGKYYNVICGTGFFSYIAHTDEFCLVSTLGVNCYAFSPVCGQPLSNNYENVKKLNKKRYSTNKS